MVRPRRRYADENDTLYRGPSLYGGEVAVQGQNVRRVADNDKTGDMVALAIWSTRGIPYDVIAQADACGGCSALGSWCYVVKSRMRGSWNRIREVVADLREFGRRRRVKRTPIRLGSDGDPCAVPLEWWERFFGAVPADRNGWTGYTHGWKARKGYAACDPGFASFLMASCDTEEEAREARALGYRPFRVGPADSPLMPGEIVCPYVSSNGRIQCDECLLCDGNARGMRRTVGRYFRKMPAAARPGIFAPVHGGSGQGKRYAELHG